MDSKMKELSMEEMDMVTGGLEQPQYFEEVNKKLTRVNLNSQQNNQDNSNN